MFRRHSDHADGGDTRLTNEKGGVTLVKQKEGCTFVSTSGEPGEIYRAERSPRPPDLTSRQAARIGLIPLRPKSGLTASPLPSAQEYPDLVGHFQPEELTPETLGNLKRMAEIAQSILRR